MSRGRDVGNSRSYKLTAMVVPQGINNSSWSVCGAREGEAPSMALLLPNAVEHVNQANPHVPSWVAAVLRAAQVGQDYYRGVQVGQVSGE